MEIHHHKKENLFHNLNLLLNYKAMFLLEIYINHLLSALEAVLGEMGANINKGVAVSAAQAA